MGVVYKDVFAGAHLLGRTDPAVEVFLLPCLLSFSPFGRQLDERSCPFKDVRLLLLCRGWSSIWRVVVDVQCGVSRIPCEDRLKGFSPVVWWTCVL